MTHTSTETRSNTFLPALAVAGTVVTWAASFPAIGFALRQIEPLPLASVRFALAAVLAFAWLAWKRPARMSIRDYTTIVICGLLGIALYNILLNSGQATVSAGAASFIVNTQPLFMVGLAVLFLKERFSRWSWLGAVLGFSGVAVISLGQVGGFSFGSGAMLILGAAACAAAFSVLQRPLFARSGSLDVTSLVLIAGALTLLPWLPAGLSQFSASSPDTMLVVVFLAVAPAAIGQTCWTYALKSFGAARAGQFLYLIPPCAVLFSWIGLGETPVITTVLGGALALTGVIVVNTLGRR